MIDRLICEHKLPVPDSILTDDSDDFKGVNWNEHEFYTASFARNLAFHDDPFSRGVYTISEDGQIYKDIFEIEIEVDEKGETLAKEEHKGLERLSHTGEIQFGTEIYGKEIDHEIIFKCLFFKGELKELDLESYVKHNNEARKESAKRMSCNFQKEIKRKMSPTYALLSPFKTVALQIVKVVKWLMFKFFVLVVKLETWCRR